MNLQIGILILFIPLLVSSIAGILPLNYVSICVFYLATAQAVGVITGARSA